MECEDCGGTGYDFGSTREFDPEDCPRCSGSGTELVFRNYLAEAFHIISDPECRVPLCREHIVAMATYARQTVSALFSSRVIWHADGPRNSLPLHLNPFCDLAGDLLVVQEILIRVMKEHAVLLEERHLTSVPAGRDQSGATDIGRSQRSGSVSQILER